MDLKKEDSYDFCDLESDEFDHQDYDSNNDNSFPETKSISSTTSEGAEGGDEGGGREEGVTRRKRREKRSDKKEDKSKILIKGNPSKDKVREIISTELEYVHDLEILTLVTTASDSYSVLNLQTILGNIMEVINVSRRFLQSLQTAVYCKEEEMFVGKVFLEFYEELAEVYKIYCCAYKADVIPLIKKCEGEETSAIALKEMAKQLRNHKKHLLDLNCVLNKPVQRFLKYPVYLEELIQSTPNDHLDANNLQRAKESYHISATDINENTKEVDIAHEDNSLQGKMKRISLRSFARKSFRATTKFSFSQKLGVVAQEAELSPDTSQEKEAKESVDQPKQLPSDLAAKKHSHRKKEKDQLPKNPDIIEEEEELDEEKHRSKSQERTIDTKNTTATSTSGAKADFFKSLPSISKGRNRRSYRITKEHAAKELQRMSASYYDYFRGWSSSSRRKNDQDKQEAPQPLDQHYPKEIFYKLNDDHNGDGEHELTLKKGDLVAVLKKKDPMGGSERWVVDTGDKIGFVRPEYLSSLHSPIQSTNKHQDNLEDDFYTDSSDEWDNIDKKDDDIDDDPPLSSTSLMTTNNTQKQQEQQDCYLALYAFNAGEDGTQICLRSGQIVFGIVTDSKDWWYVEDEKGHQGYVPASYLQPMEKDMSIKL